MLESFLTDEFKYEKLTEEDQKKRGILGRLVGVIADSANPTRNGRKYGKELWEKLFENPIMKERINNRCCFGELGHPADREETDIEKIAICLAEVPKFNKQGQLCGVFDILDTPNGRILKSLCDYGCNIGVSSRGSGDIITDFDGQESVDPNTYTCEGWDAVLIPAVTAARPKYVNEALDKKRYNKSLREKLQESINNATPDNKKVIEESLETLGINLNEDAYTKDELINKFGTDNLDIINAGNEEDVTLAEPKYYRLQVYVPGDPETGMIDDKFDIIKVIKANSLDEAEDILKTDKENFGGYVVEATKEDFDDYNDNNGSYSETIKEEEVNESLNESASDDKLLDDLCNDILDYFIEQGYSIESDNWFGFNNWKEVKDDLAFIGSDLYEIGEGLIQEFKGYFKLIDRLAANAKKRGSDFDHYDDPEYALFKDWYNSLTRIFDRLNKETMGESLFNRKLNSMAVADNKAVVEELQKALKQNNILEKQIMSLQEKLSVSNAEAKESGDYKKKYINSISKLSESNKKIKALELKNTKLDEKFNEYKKSLDSYREAYNQQKDKINSLKTSLNESISNKEDLNSLRESYEQKLGDLKKSSDIKIKNYDRQIAQSKSIIEDLKKKVTSVINKYISIKADMSGSTVNEVLSRLPENYTLSDIDNICEDLENYNLSLNGLPFSTMREDYSFRAKSPKREPILNIVNNPNDEIDDQLKNLMKNLL